MSIFQFLRRKWLLRRSFPHPQSRILEQRVPYYRHLSDSLKQTLRDRMMIFMDEKNFEGCGGLEMTEEKKVIIAAYACILLLGAASDYYPDLQSILVYPDDYMAPVREERPGGIISEGVEARKGESWDLGSIVLSWKDIRQNIDNSSARQNLIFHEFAHQLDRQYSLTAGVGEQGEVFREDEWTRIFAKAFRTLQQKSRRNQRCALDPYGATHPAELFAVATEAFFLAPHRLRREFARLYEMFESFYNIDPRSFFSG